MKIIQLTKSQKCKRYPIETLHKFWANGETIQLDRKKYRVGRMSYGQYFFEPGKERGETEPFNPGTLWLEQLKDDPYWCKISEVI